MLSANLPLIIFDGNCQGQHLASIVTASNFAECYAIGQDLGFLPSHLGIACQYISEETAYQRICDARNKGRWTIQASQSTPRSDHAELSYSNLVDQIIRYPHLQFYALSPTEILHNFGPKATSKRVMEMDIGIMKTCQERAKSSVDFAEFIRENASRRSLFHTSVHPCGELMGMMLKSFAEQIPGVDQRLISCAVALLNESEGINSSTFHPIPSEVLNALGFDWGEDYELYRHLLNQRAASDWHGILNNQKLYIEKFSNDTWCWLALTQAHTAIGTKSEALMSLLRLLDLSPGHLHSWICGQNIYLKYDDLTGVSSLMHRASAFFKGQRIFSQIMAYFHLNNGNAEGAEAYARDYYARTPDRADALVPLLKTLWFLSKNDEIKQIMDFVLNNASDSRLAEIRANFIGSPELEPYLLASG